uniref:Uncharacterized protein n=1 Tax=Panagrolaimus sp. ES5 TaxID=591445 RepID=A0AC34EZQ7_9BILA
MSGVPLFIFSNIAGSQLIIRCVPADKLMRLYEAGEEFMCTIECYCGENVQSITYSSSDSYKMRELFSETYRIIYGCVVPEDSGFQF